MNLKYDIHLSAYQISKLSIKKFESIGFKRDEFSNNTRCEITVYHGTYRGLEKLPSVELWKTLCNILNEDEMFSGGLEEEEFDESNIFFFENSEFDINKTLPPMELEQPAINIYKACDIHINIDIESSHASSLKQLELLGAASFDKSKDHKTHRVFTITTETLEHGSKIFDILSKFLKFNGLKGRMKLEKTTNFFRKPTDSYALPLLSRDAFHTWITKFSKDDK